MENSRISRDSGARTPPVQDNPDIFSDDYAIEHHDTVVDGFRPLLDQETALPRASASMRRSLSIGNPIESKTTPTISQPRSSISKGYAALDPQRLSRDGPRGVPLPQRAESLRSSSSAATPYQQQRSNSTSSSSTLTGNVRSQSPFQGASGPSHPYALYPQGVGVDRSLSSRTSSTLRGPPRSESSATRPAHPYGMYPQNVFADPEDGEVSPVDESIPVGFPGHSTDDRFHRRLGPEGEEQDIIGPDGHTEQLPPYTRFPENMAGKGMAIGESESEADVQPLNSNETLIRDTQEQIANATSTDASNRRSGTVEQMESGLPEKSWSEKSWREKRHTRFCSGRFPFWILLLAAGLVLLLAAIIGGIVGGFVAHDHAEAAAASRSIASFRSAHSLIDASTIPTPANLPMLPTGTYGVPLGIPQESQSSCLTDPSQIDTWSCNLANEPHMAPVNLLVNNEMGGMAMAQVINPEAGSPIQYGTQPPQFGPAPLYLVMDLEAPNLGPAYYFQSTYNKTVILDSSMFDPSQKTKRNQNGQNGQNNYYGNQFFHHRNDVSPGDQPWVCFWNSTSVELFVYDTHNVSASAVASLSSMVSASEVPSTSTSSSDTFSPATPTISVSDSSITSAIPVSASSDTPTSSIAISPTTTTLITSAPTAAASTTPGSSPPNIVNSFTSSFSANSENFSPPNPYYPSPPQGFQGSRRRDDSSNSNSNNGNNGNNGNDGNNGNSGNSGNNGKNGNNNDNNSNNNQQGPTFIYPRAVKIEERRLPGIGAPPYCTRMQVLNDGTLGYVQNPDGSQNPWNVYLQESDPNFFPPPSGSGGRVVRREAERDARTGLWILGKRDPGNSCHCEWLSS
ncbi:hypothetical protein EV356DRAFT_512553 [Viridothelium virens]|uniref:DUF7820 domain-containing protein n=1 Tax=Viridothelium virens TaxID=1048519 RepID=A0A6A6HG44_VIRVR|nr:hypothetical protein EV356DRAFT_512553 [Viridothelium virens]